MARILYLVHRLPYPPNKGDKVRSYHLLRHLAQRHEVLLGTFVDDPDDEQHVPMVRAWCVEVKAVRLHPLRARLASLLGLLRGEPLTLAYYRDVRLARWVRQQQFDAVVVFSSSMAQYAEQAAVPILVDFVDVDSAKWTEYANAHRWPMSWLYRREGVRLLSYERKVAARSSQSYFVTEKEAGLFTGLAPEAAPRVQAMGNGVDTTYFAPDPARPNPFDADVLPLVFTGAMDYWPNVDAMVWFVAEMLPALRRRWPNLRLFIVGRSPTPAVLALAGDAVHVTGTVADVRPWLQHAAVVVAPLRLARGVQNKVLEAMAMGRPVVAARSCAEAIEAVPGRDIETASEPADYVRCITALLEDGACAQRVAMAARTCVALHYGWTARLSAIDRCLPDAVSA
jgi:sugar transferase (PEP-CTERM/EpsH1 system associated)